MKNTQGWIQHFTLLEQNIPKPIPTLLPVLLQGQQEDGKGEIQAQSTEAQSFAASGGCTGGKG